MGNIVVGDPDRKVPCNLLEVPLLRLTFACALVVSGRAVGGTENCSTVAFFPAGVVDTPTTGEILGFISTAYFFIT